MNPAPVLRLDLDANVLMANAAAEDVFGSDLTARCWKDVCPGMDDAVWAGVVAAPGLVPVDVGMGKRDFVFTHRRDAAEGDVFVYGADVTELRAQERLLEAQAAALAEVARFPDMNPAPVLRLDLDGTVLLSNRAANVVFGDELAGRCWKDICPGLDDGLWERMLEAIEPLPIEASVDGREFVFAHRRDTEAELVFVFGADITEQKLAERGMRQAEKLAALGKLSAGLAHELNNPAAAAGRAAAHLEQGLADLEAATFDLARAGATAERWAFLADVRRRAGDRRGEGPALSALDAADRALELESWLEAREIEAATTIAAAFVDVGFTTADIEQIAAELPAEQLGAACVWLCRSLEVSDYAATVARSSRAISDLIEVVKSYSYMDQMPIQDVDIERGIEDTLTILGHAIRDKEIRVVRDYDSHLPPVPAPGSELNQVWTNLIDNAVDAMEEGGTLTIRTVRDGDSVTVEIEDDGAGIPDELQARVFDPFFTTKDVGQGTGLGLDVVRRIVVERVGGELDLRSRPGETVFRVRLPVEQ